MKKFIYCFTAMLIFILNINIFQTKANGEEYIRIISADTYLYKTDSFELSNAMFYLPKTYYCKVTDSGAEFYEVEYSDNTDGFAKIIGYVKKNEVMLWEKTPTFPIYPFQSLTVKASNSYLYQSPLDTSTEISAVFENQKILYYGKMPSSEGLEYFYYVKLGKSFGYIKAAHCSTLNIYTHPDKMPVPDPAPKPDKPNVNDEVKNVPLSEKLQILIIIGITIPALLIVFFLFKPDEKKKVSELIGKSSNNFEDDGM